MSEKTPMEQHLQTAMYGTPKINPDEQRKYLGTFRERVSLAMTIAEVTNRDNISDFVAEITDHPNYQVIFNGHIDQADLAPYLKLVGQHNLKFTIREEAIYGINDSDLGLVVASDQAINQSPITLRDKYPTSSAETTSSPTKTSWFDKLLGR